MKLSQVKKKLRSYGIEELGKEHGFNLRLDAKITPLSFVLGFFTALSEEYSLRLWAEKISLTIGVSISKAGLQKRFTTRAVNFALALLSYILKRNIWDETLAESGKIKFFSPFKHVYIEDSTCLSLPKVLASIFPGSYSHSGKSATARLQVCLELKRHVFRKFFLGCFRNNDQSYSPEVLSYLQAGDLVIRDMGYWALSVYAQIVKGGAFIISRFRYGTYIYDPSSGQRIEMAKLLKKATAKGQRIIDISVKVGKKAQIPFRLVAQRLPDSIANERIRKAREDRHQKANHSKEYYEQLKWNIFITNVAKDIWEAHELRHVYGFRWRIEILFKVWKSKLGLKSLFSSWPIHKLNHLYIFLYLFLAYATLIHLRYFSYFFHRVYQYAQKYISLGLFVQFVQQNTQKLLEAEQIGTLDQYIWQIASFYTHEKRKSRTAQIQLLWMG